MILDNGESDGDPVSIILSDKILIIACVVFILILLFMLYGKVLFGV